MSKRIINKTLSAAIVAALYAGAGHAQQTAAEPPKAATELETVVVTGSLIKGTPEDASLPVEVFTAEELKLQGDPSPLEFVKDLTISGPTTGEAYYFGGSANTNNVQFNLRGIGADKTLTLFNGRRGFQNVVVYPGSVVERTEILKDGAAVTYGADATGGVVNLITRRSFDGYEVGGSYKTYDGSDAGEWKLNGIAGFSTDNANILFAVEWDHRSELHSYERDFANLPYGVNPAPWSNLTGLASWTPRSAPPGTAPPGTPPAAAANMPNVEFGNPSITAALNPGPYTPANPRNQYITDFTQSSCEAVRGVYQPRTVAPVPGVGSVVVAPPTCYYGYLGYYNLVEENDVYRVYAQVTADLSDTAEFYMRALWAMNDSPHQYGSPSQPVIRGPARGSGATNQLYVPSINPHVAAFSQRIGFAGNAAFPATTGYTPFTYRAFSHGGNQTFAEGDNNSTPNENVTKYWHISTGFTGDWFGDALSYDVAGTYNQFVSTNTAPDILGFRLQEALNGFGGPNCRATDADPTRFGTQAVAAGGVDTGVRPAGCLWYNPFASNFASQPVFGNANPSYIAGAQNSDELVRWIFNKREFETSNYNFTFDAVFSGATPWTLFGNDTIAWAGGAQWRTQKNRESVPDALYNGNTPCDWPGQDPADPNSTLYTGCTPDGPGPFMFFGTNVPDATQQQQRSYFAEVNLPILDSLNLSGAVRNEQFSGDLEATVYKVSAKWQVIEFDNASFALRGSYGTNYQAPGPAVIPGDIANGVNSYTIAGGNWRGATTVTRSDIEPETATVWGVGAIADIQLFDSHDIQIILDYFSIETQDELGLLATANDIANSVFSIIPPGGTSLPTNGTALANCAHALISRVTFNGGACTQGVTSANDFSNITTDFGNGPGQTTAGFDVQVSYTLPLGPGTLRLASTATKVEKFEFSPTILDGYVLRPADDRLGTLNFATIAQAAPEWRANFSVNYGLDQHNFRAVLNYVSGVKDERYIKTDGTINVPALIPGGLQPGTTSAFTPSYYGVIGDYWLSADLHYVWRADFATLGLSVLNVTDQDPPESRQEFGYDPRIGNPLGRQIELSIRKEF